MTQHTDVTDTPRDPAVDQAAGRHGHHATTQFLARYGTVVALLVVFTVFSFASAQFLSVGNLFNLLRQISTLAVVATGLTVCIAAGEFDLSTGSVASLGGILATGLIVNQGLAATVAVFVAIAVGVLFGLLNGTLVSILRIPSLITTLGTSSIAIGVNYAYSGGASVYGELPTSFKVIGQGYVGTVPVNVITAGIIVGAAYLLLEKSRVGRYVVATGANPTAARLSGLRISRYRLLGLIASGGLAAFAGVMLASYLGTGQPNGGDIYTLLSLTVVFVGMSTIRPGQANIAGSLIGILLIGVMNNGLNLLGTPFYVQQIVTGAILVAAVTLAVLKEELRFFS